MGEDTDRLRQEIDQKRDDAAAKIDQIEAKMQDTAQMAKDTVQDTVQTAKDAVDDTVHKVKESVDLVKQVEERPLAALGAALAGGFLLGGVLGGGKDGRQGRSHDGYAAGAQQGGAVSSLRGAARDSGLEEMISGIAGALMGSLSQRLRSTVEETFPQLADQIKQHQGGDAGRRESAASGSRTYGREFGTAGSSPTMTDAAGRSTPYMGGESGSNTIVSG